MDRSCRFSSVWLSCIAAAIVPLSVLAQAKGTKPEVAAPTSLGSVTGHVFFAGNNLPVRFAHVALQPLDVKSTSGTGKADKPSFQIYQTDLAGAFVIDHVVPGTYFVVVKYPGSLSPLANFSESELEQPTAEQAKALASSIPTVSVALNSTASIDVRLQGGASMSGTVRFDDGTPFANAQLSVERRGADGKWASPRATDSSPEADLGGHWELGGLPPGEYRVSVSLRIEDLHLSSLLANGGSSWSNTTFGVAIYAGDTERQQDAKSTTLTDNEAVNNLDITIPIAKMHTVSGAVVDARTGQALNSGRVALVDAESGTEMTAAKIDPQSRTYSLPFVCEGTYKLQTKNAREARVEQIPYPEGSFGTPQTKEISVREYGPGEVPLVVTGEMSAVNLPVTAKAQ